MGFLATKVYEVMYLICKSVFKTLYIEIKHKS